MRGILDGFSGTLFLDRTSLALERENYSRHWQTQIMTCWVMVPCQLSPSRLEYNFPRMAPLLPRAPAPETGIAERPWWTIDQESWKHSSRMQPADAHPPVARTRPSDGSSLAGSQALSATVSPCKPLAHLVRLRSEDRSAARSSCASQAPTHR